MASRVADLSISAPCGARVGIRGARATDDVDEQGAFAAPDRSRAFEDLHRDDIAQGEFRAVLDMPPDDSPDDAEALQRLASIAHTNRRYAEAADLVERLLKLQPKADREKGKTPTDKPSGFRLVTGDGKEIEE
jgi:hypothetical protein